MSPRTPILLLAALLLAGLMLSPPAQAAKCGGDFNSFISEFSREAQAAGISAQAISTAFSGITHDPNVMAFDRRQRGTFRKSFEEYAATRVTPPRIKRAKTMG